MTAHHHGAGASPGLWAVWLLIAIMVSLYLRAASRRAHWSGWRTASFATGGVLLLAAFSVPAVAWAHADLRGHMAQHLLLGMFGPFFLVMGAPVKLLLGAVPAMWARRWVRILGSGPVRMVAHPVSALVLNIGGMVLLYATPLYAMSKEHLWLHGSVHYHFVAAGCLFAWSIAGPDPAPHRPSLRARGIVLFLGIAIHSTLAKLMYVQGWPAGTGASLKEIQAAAQWMYYGGDVAEMLLIAALLSTWMHRSEVTGHGRVRISSAPAEEKDSLGTPVQDPFRRKSSVDRNGAEAAPLRATEAPAHMPRRRFPHPKRSCS